MVWIVGVPECSARVAGVSPTASQKAVHSYGDALPSILTPRCILAGVDFALRRKLPKNMHSSVSTSPVVLQYMVHALSAALFTIVGAAHPPANQAAIVRGNRPACCTKAAMVGPFFLHARYIHPKHTSHHI